MVRCRPPGYRVPLGRAVRTGAALVAPIMIAGGGLVACSSSPGSSGANREAATVTTSHPDPTATPTPRPARPAVTTLTAEVVGPALPRPISRAAAVAIDGRVVVLGGRTAAHVSTDEVVSWSPNGAVAVRGQLARRVHDNAATVLGGRPLVFGGGDGGSVADVQAVPLDGPASRIGSLPEARSDLSAATVGRTAYVVGGFDDVTGPRAVLATTDGIRFTEVAMLPKEVRYGAVVAYRGRLLVFGGESEAGAGRAVLEIDPGSGGVRQVATLSVPLAHASAFVLAGRVYVAGGRTSETERHAEIWRYDPDAGSMVGAGMLPDARSDAAVAVLGGTAYLLGGESPATLDTVIAVHP